MKMLVSAFAQTDQQDVHLIKHLTTIHVCVVAQSPLNVPEVRGLIPIHVNVSVLDQGQTAQPLNTTTTLTANVHVEIDQRGAPTIKHSITMLVVVVVLIPSSAPENKHSIPTLVSVNVPDQDQPALHLNTMMTIHANALVQIGLQDVPTIKHTIMTPANVVVPQ